MISAIRVIIVSHLMEKKMADNLDKACANMAVETVQKIKELFFKELTGIVGDELVPTLMCGETDIRMQEKQIKQLREKFDRDLQKVKDRAEKLGKADELNELFDKYKTALSEAANDAWRQEIEAFFDIWFNE